MQTTPEEIQHLFFECTKSKPVVQQVQSHSNTVAQERQERARREIHCRVSTSSTDDSTHGNGSLFSFLGIDDITACTKGGVA